MSEQELQKWSRQEEPTFVVVVDDEQSRVSWIEESPDSELRLLRRQFTWAKALKSRVPKSFGVYRSPSLMFKIGDHVYNKTWVEEWEISNWIDAVVEGHRRFMGYDDHGTPVEGETPDEIGLALIDSLYGRPIVSEGSSLFEREFTR
jgi:hypothetical protein